MGFISKIQDNFIKHLNNTSNILNVQKCTKLFYNQMGKVVKPNSELNNGDRLSKSKTLDIINRIKQDYEEKGRINKLELSREFKVHRATMTRLVNNVTIDMDKLPAIQTEMKMIFERIRNRLFTLLDKLEEMGDKPNAFPNIKAELEVTKAITDNVEKFYKLLQELGEAPKVADKLQVEANVVSSISVNITTFDNERIKDVDAMEVLDYDRIANNS